MLNIIVAIDKSNAIGYKNKLLFNLPNDLKHFKELTIDHKVVMGRKTFDSLPKLGLPNRQNYVITHDENKIDMISKNQSIRYLTNDNDIKQFIEEYINSDEEVFIIGGSEIYKKFLPYVNKIYMTYVDKSAKNKDAYFLYNQEEFVEDENSIEYHNENGIDYYFIELNRI